MSRNNGEVVFCADCEFAGDIPNDVGIHKLASFNVPQTNSKGVICYDDEYRFSEQIVDPSRPDIEFGEVDSKKVIKIISNCKRKEDICKLEVAGYIPVTANDNIKRFYLIDTLNANHVGIRSLGTLTFKEETEGNI